jgi:hypothetical protein
MGAGLAVSGRISVAAVVEAMRAASDEEMADMMAEMFRGNVIFQERQRAAGTLVEAEAEAEAEVKAVAAKEPKAKEPKAKEPKAPKAKEPKAPKADIPQGDLSEAPGPEHYRLKEVKEGLCKARKTEGGEDRRWKPIVYGESQCTRKPVEGEDLCKICSTCFERESQDDKFKKWHGLVTEDLMAHTRILGSEITAKYKWIGTAAPVSAPVSAPESAAGSAPASEGEEAPAPVATPAKAPAKKEAKAPAAPKKAKAVTKAEATAETKAEEPKPAAAPAAAAVSEPVAEAGELKLIGGEFYWVSRGNVYEYDQIEETPGDFVGRLRADESIDADAEEETAE